MPNPGDFYVSFNPNLKIQPKMFLYILCKDTLAVIPIQVKASFKLRKVLLMRCVIQSFWNFYYHVTKAKLLKILF